LAETVLCYGQKSSDRDDRETQLIKDPLIVRIVKILNITSLSILELLEYNLSLKDIDYSMANRVIQYDKPTTTREEMSALGIPLGGDYYYNLLKGKVKLTELGLHLLDSLKSR
jgi:hypothetical protein